MADAADNDRIEEHRSGSAKLNALACNEHYCAPPDVPLHRSDWHSVATVTMRPRSGTHLA